MTDADVQFIIERLIRDIGLLRDNVHRDCNHDAANTMTVSVNPPRA